MVGGVIQVLVVQKLVGKVLVLGQDVDFVVVKCVIVGMQMMMVYKLFKLIVIEVVQFFVVFVKGDKLKFNVQYDNGKKKVDMVLL